MSSLPLTQERLRQLLDYNPETGVFTVLLKRGTLKIGSTIGHENEEGYLAHRISGKSYLLHRLAWLYMTGSWPKAHIDHRDENRANNTFSNLREATHSQNLCNRGPTARNPSGCKGVTWYKRTSKWRVRIDLNKRQYHLGFFDDIEKANTAYREACLRLHGQFANWGGQ